MYPEAYTVHVWLSLHRPHVGSMYAAFIDHVESKILMKDR